MENGKCRVNDSVRRVCGLTRRPTDSTLVEYIFARDTKLSQRTIHLKLTYVNVELLHLNAVAVRMQISRKFFCFYFIIIHFVYKYVL